MPLKILIVEDEPKLASLESDYLVQSGYETAIISNGLEVLPYIQTTPPDLILLDLMLPGKDGMEICKEIRQFSNIPIIMITARVEEIDRLLGLELGADDYICKPFSPREVVARVKAVLRRFKPPTPVENSNTFPDTIVLDERRYTALVNKQEINLTSVEFQLLSKLFSEPGRIYSRDQLMDHIYNDHRVVSDRTIDSHIKKIRKKISEASPDQELIHSVYGVGYKFEQED